ncbi:MAG TPA: TetR/AcrR family transcriptional regulator [Novosphingobium sp.]|nr:TetR/AcrR family transcriptional regulator [Novosphingobium sp.]
MFEIPSLNIKARTGVYANGQERVVQILETALEILIQDGFSAVTLREIARRMDIRVSAINHYYSTREALVLDMLAGVLNSYEDFFERFRAPSDEPPEARLRAVMGVLLDDIMTLKTTRLFPELWALANRDATVARMIDVIYIRSRLILARFIALINPALDLRTRENLALLISASLEGLTVFAGHGKPWQGEMERVKALACDGFVAMVKAAQPLGQTDPDWRPPTLVDAETYARLADLDG